MNLNNEKVVTLRGTEPFTAHALIGGIPSWLHIAHRWPAAQRVTERFARLGGLVIVELDSFGIM